MDTDLDLDHHDSDFRSSSVPGKRLRAKQDKYNHPPLAFARLDPSAISSEDQETSDATKPQKSHLSIQLPKTLSQQLFLSPDKSKDKKAYLAQRKHDQKLFTAMLQDDTDTEFSLLPDFEDWELESEYEVDRSRGGGDGEWGTLVERAVHSNRERLRRRLEGDGWDFVGGRYGEGEEVSEADSDRSDGSVDEEFDVVILETI